MIALAVSSAAFAHCSWLSWRKWGDLLFDAGRELELPARMASGAILYVDVRNLYGPLPYYVNAALYQVFGIHLDVLVGAGLVSAAAMGASLYLLARRFLGIAPATVVVVAFFYCCAFGHLTSNAIFNFVIPYSYAASYGSLTGCLSLMWLVRHVQLGSDRSLALSLLFGALTFLCKLEIALAVALAHGAYLIAAVSTKTITWRRIGGYVVATAGVASVYGLLYLRAGAGLWTDNIFSAARSDGSGRPVLAYARWSMGLDDVPGSLLAVAASVLLLGLAVGVGLGCDRVIRRVGSPAFSRIVCATAAIGVAGAYAVTPITVPLRAMPVLLVAALAWLVARWWRSAVDRRDLVAHLVLWAFIAGCLSRQMLRVVPEHYGFYLVPVSLVGLALFTFRYVPAWSGGMTADVRASAWTAGGVLVGITIGCFIVSGAEYARHRLRLETPRGTPMLRDDGTQAALVGALAEFPRQWKAIVVPQGAGYVFMSGLAWNDGTFAYAPSDLTGGYADDQLPAKWARHPPDVVVFLRLAGGYGAPEFGEGYAQRSAAWLGDNYRFALHPGGFAVGLPRSGPVAAPAQ
jgi:hypothetical protein